MNGESEQRLRALEQKQTEHQITIERVVFVVEDMKSSVDEIKGYMKSAVTVMIGSAITAGVGGLATLIWYGLRSALQVTGH